MIFYTAKSEVLRRPYYTQKLQTWEDLHPPQKLQNREFCVVLKMLLIIFNTPKSEVLRILHINSKIGGFAPTARKCVL